MRLYLVFNMFLFFSLARIHSDSQDDFFKAVNIGDSRSLVRLLMEGAKIDLPNNKNESALILAIKRNDYEMVKSLIALGADVNHYGPNRNSPLMISLEEGNTFIASYLIQKGANTMEWNTLGETPLMIAVRNGLFSIADSIVKDGGNIYLSTIEPQPLSTIYRISHLSNRLLKWNSPAHETPGIKAIKYKNYSLLSELLNSNRNIANERNIEEQTPLMFAAGIALPVYIGRLISHGAKVNTLDRHGFSPLYYAVMAGETQNARKLLDAGADPLLATSIENTPFFIAMVNHYNDLFDLLMDAKKGPVYMTGNEGLTLLMYASFLGDYRIINTLLEEGFSPFDRDSNQMTAIDHLLVGVNFHQERSNFYEAAKLLRQYGPPPSNPYNLTNDRMILMILEDTSR